MNTISSLLKFIGNKISDMGGLKMKTVTIPNVTIPAGTASAPASYEHDFANDGITGTIWAIAVTLNTAALPYIENDSGKFTWVRSISSGTKMTIANSTSAWNNYTLYAVIWYK